MSRKERGGVPSEVRTKGYMFVGSPITPFGGVIRRLRLWLSHAPDDAEVAFVYYSSSDAEALFSQNAEWTNVSLDCTPSLGRWGRVFVLPAIFSILKRILRRRPSILVSFFPWAMLSAGVATRLARIIGVRVHHVLHLAGDPAIPAKSAWLRFLYRNLFRLTIRLCDDIVVLSDSLANTLQLEFNVPSRVTVRVVPISIVSHPQPKQHTEKRSVLTFGMVSRLSAVKKCDVALRAFAQMRDSLPARLLVFGTGPEEAYLRQLCTELDISEDVSFCGWTNDPLSAFSKIDCVLLPSMSEGTPRAILEAGSVGVPTIASSVGGIPDMIVHNETGWLTEPADVDEFTSIMLEIAKTPDILSEVGGRAKAEVDARPTHAEEIRQVLNLS